LQSANELQAIKARIPKWAKDQDAPSGAGAIKAVAKYQ